MTFSLLLIWTYDLKAKDTINIVASNEKKAEDILVLLFNNLVSPIHLIDVVGEYSDLCVNDFGF